jgi:putative SOS response-associated peptidase YedK
VHDRMPVILPPDRYDIWLDPGVQDEARLMPVLQPCPSAILEMYAVWPKVNSPANDSPENIQKVETGNP